MHSARRDVFKIIVFIIASMLLGALLAPWLYRAGKAFADLVGEDAGSGLAAFVADAARRSAFPRFFDRAVLLATWILLLPTIHWLRIGRRAGRFRDTPWSLRIPDAQVDRAGQPLHVNPHGWRDAVIGALLSASILLLVGRVLTATGWFRWREDVNLIVAATEAAPSAIVVPFVEEIIFRGVLLGMFLRAMRPSAAIATVAFLFAAVHFFKPPYGVEITDPESAWAGFELLGHILGRYGEPASMLGEFGTLVTVGFVLGYARWRTASLWLPAGLHSGWVFALILFKSITWPVASIQPPARYLVGYSLRDGIIPMIVVAATGFLIHALTSSDDRNPPTEPD